MNIDEAYKKIRQRYKDVVETPLNLQTQYDNMPFTEPTGLIYAKLTIQPGDTAQRSIGDTTKRYRTAGMLIVSIFGALEKGDEPIVQLADSIALAFRPSTYQSVVFRTPSVIRVGRAGKWWQYNVFCPWYLDKIA